MDWPAVGADGPDALTADCDGGGSGAGFWSAASRWPLAGSPAGFGAGVAGVVTVGSGAADVAGVAVAGVVAVGSAAGVLGSGAAGADSGSAGGAAAGSAGGAAAV